MTVATRSEWQAAVEKEYRFETEAGTRALPELFEGRSQLRIYHLMYGESFARGACPGCSNHCRRDVEGYV